MHTVNNAALAQQRALRASALSALLFSISGLLLGVLSGSVMILFDSGYSLLSLMLASLSLYALRQAKRPASRDYPFGRLTIEPMAILVKGVVISLVCIVSIVLALTSIWYGGRQVQIDLALGFGALNVTGCLLTWWYIERCRRRSNTALVAAETRQWQMDTWLSVAVLAGFAVAYAMRWSPWPELAVYADPVMVLLIASYFLPIPWRMMRQAIQQILFAAPAAELTQAIHQRLALLGFEHARLAQVGSFLIVQLPANAPQSSQSNPPQSDEILVADTLSTVLQKEQLKALVVRQCAPVRGE